MAALSIETAPLGRTRAARPEGGRRPPDLEMRPVVDPDLNLREDFGGLA